MNSAWQTARRLTTFSLAARNQRSGLATLCKSLATVSSNSPISQKVDRFPVAYARLKSTTAKKFEVINIQDEEDFKKRVIDASSSVPVIVDFHASWCGPCKLLGPRLETIAAEEQGKVQLVKVDIDENAELAMDHGVQSVPTVIGMKNGQVLIQFIGLIDDDQIRSFIDKLVHS